MIIPNSGAARNRGKRRRRLKEPGPCKPLRTQLVFPLWNELQSSSIGRFETPPSAVAETVNDTNRANCEEASHGA
jgi:hypothetical protein